MPAHTPLISPHTRGVITRKVGDGKPWKGTRNGFRIEVQQERQLNFTRNRIEWRARRIPGPWETGHAPSVYEAVQEIEDYAARVTPTR